MKRILVPTDFSEHAEYALRVAAQIAKQNNNIDITNSNKKKKQTSKYKKKRSQ